MFIKHYPISTGSVIDHSLFPEVFMQKSITHKLCSAFLMAFISTTVMAQSSDHGTTKSGTAGMSSSRGVPSELVLTGAQEVPPVPTKASGKSTIKIATDRSVSGVVTTEGVAGTAAHIHEGPIGKAGPVILPLTKTSANTFSVPANAKLSDAQYASYLAGNLYVNVHSAAHPEGEIRAQLNTK